MSVGALIKERRLEMERTRSWLARKLDTSDQAVWTWETDRVVPRVATCLELEQLLGWEPSTIARVLLDEKLAERRAAEAAENENGGAR